MLPGGLGDRQFKHSVLRTGEQVEIRPVRPSDEEALASFFNEVPQRSTQNAPNSSSTRETINHWLQGDGSDHVIPLAVAKEQQILALGSLSFAMAGPYRWIGDLTIASHPEYGHLGLGKLVMSEFLELAKELRLSKLVVRIPAHESHRKDKVSKYPTTAVVRVYEDHYRDAAGGRRDLLVVEVPGE